MFPTRTWMGMELRWNSRRRFCFRAGCWGCWPSENRRCWPISNCCKPSADIDGFLGKMLGKPEHLRKRHHFVMFFSSFELGMWCLSLGMIFQGPWMVNGLPHYPFFWSVKQILLLCKFGEFFYQRTARTAPDFSDIWVWVKIRYPNNWMVNTKLDISICGPINGLPFWPTSDFRRCVSAHSVFCQPWISTILRRMGLTSECQVT